MSVYISIHKTMSKNNGSPQWIQTRYHPRTQEQEQIQSGDILEIFDDAIIEDGTKKQEQVDKKRKRDETDKDEKREVKRYKISHEHLYCPITRHIFKNPVIAGDGHVYEHVAIMKWLKTHNTSPVTKQRIDKSVYNVYMMKTIIYEVLLLHPELRVDQYNIQMPYNRKEIEKIICDKQYEKLKEYIEYMITDVVCTSKKSILERLLIDGCDDEIIIYVLNNCIDLECDLSASKMRFAKMITKLKPIHMICALGSSRIIKHVIEKGVNIECMDGDKWKPLHYILDSHGNDMEIIEYMVGKVTNYSDTCNDSFASIICKTGTYETIKYFVENGLEKGLDIIYDRDVLQVCCTQRTNKIIEYMMLHSLKKMGANHILLSERMNVEKLILTNDKLAEDEKKLLVAKVILIKYLSLIGKLEDEKIEEVMEQEEYDKLVEL